MAKVIAPLFSTKASGKLANSLVYLSWKGIDDVRSYVIPANPRTEKQQAQRSRMTQAVANYHASGFTSSDILAWNLYASILPIPVSGFNAFVREHIISAIAGKTWVILSNVVKGTPSGGTITITVYSPVDATAKLYYGTSKTAMPNEVSGTYSSTEKKWTFQITGLSAGVLYYFFIKNTASGKAGRTGIYSFVAA
jgi:hypothetical protein